MKFEFEIGQDEKYSVRFIYSKIWGTRTIIVDNQTVKRRILPFLVNVSGIILIITFLFSFALQWPTHKINLLELYILAFILACVGSVIDRIPMKVMIGEKEKYLVKIQWAWKPFPFYRSLKFKVYLNDYFFKTFEGEQLIEYVDKRIDFQKR